MTFNKAEEYIHELCKKSFFPFICYPNPFYKHKMGLVKEICDLLVILENTVLIISVKKCNFQKTNFKNVEQFKINEKRYYKNCIEKSIKQLDGAEKWLKQNSGVTSAYYIRDKEYSLNLPLNNKIKIFKIAVTIGAEEIIKEYYNCPNKSFIISSFLPFSVSSSVKNKVNYCHIITQESFDLLISTLDTVQDFIGYLEYKEKLFVKVHVICNGEEDILAFYLGGYLALEALDIMENKPNMLHLDESFYESFLSQYSAERKKTNQISYILDHLISYFYTVHLNSTLDIDISIFIKAVNILNSLNRAARKEFAEKLMELYKKPNIKPSGRFLIQIDDKKLILFYVLPFDISLSLEKYVRTRELIIDSKIGELKERGYSYEEALAIGVTDENLKELVESGNTQGASFMYRAFV